MPPENTPHTQPSTQPAPTQQQPHLNTGSIYPDATQGIASPKQLTPSHLRTSKDDEDIPKTVSSALTKLIILGVIVLGLFMAIPALLSIVGFAKIISYGKIGVLSNGGAVVYVIDGVYLAVGIGLILRRELARVAYVIIGVALLLISLFATFRYVSKNHNIPSTSTLYAVKVEAAQKLVNFDESTISNYNNNGQIPIAQRQQAIAELEANLKNDQTKLQQAKQEKAKNSRIAHNSLIQLIPTYLLAVLPLVFLTRPRVKQVFS